MADAVKLGMRQSYNTHIMRYENAAGKIFLDAFIRKQMKTSQGTSAT